MAVHTAAAFVLLGSGLFAWSWQAARVEQFNFFRWVPVIGSLTLMAMIGVVAFVSFAQLKRAIFWRGHTYEVLNVAESLLGSLTDTQRGMRGYVLTGAAAALEPYQSGTNAAPRQLARLAEITRDNPVQQERIRVLTADLDAVIAYTRELLSANVSGGLPAAIQLEKTGRGLAVMNRARADLEMFTHEEQQLLVQRDTEAAANFNNTTRLLIFGSVLAGGLLVLANFMASREVGRRRRSEEIQQDLNAQLTRAAALQYAILGSANYAIISTATDGTVTTFNATAERLLGYAAKDIIGKTTPAIWHGVNEVVARAKALSTELGRPVVPGFESFVAKAKLGLVDENEWTFIRKDGVRFPVTLSATALLDAAGQITGYLGMIADITERKRIEDELQQQRTELRLLLDFIPALVCFKDTHNKILRANKRLATPLGKTVAEVEGKATEEIYPADAAKFFADDLEVIRSGVPKLGIVETFQNQRNEAVWIQTDKAPVLDTHGKIIGLVAMAQDITERRQSEERLRESEERFRRAFDDAPIGLALVSPEGRWLQVNRALCEMLGYTEAEFLVTDFQHITHPDDLKKDWDSVLAVLAGTILSYQMEKRYFRKDGAVVYVMLSVSLVRNEAGAPLYFISQIENITKRKEAEARLTESQEKFAKAFQTSPIAIAIAETASGRYVEVNESFCQLYGFSQAEVIGRTSLELGVWKNPAEREQLLRQLRAAGSVRDLELRKELRNGDVRMLLVNADQIELDGKPCVVSLLQDITERKRAEEKVAESLREKEALLREIHHRVKNNMQVISSILQLQTNYIKDAAALEVFKDCQGRIRTMALIHEQLYRSEALAQIDFKEYLESLVGLLLRAQLGRGVNVRHEYQIALITLDADTAIPLGLIANELVSNCLKHAFAGRTAGLVRVVLRKLDDGGIQMAVQDDGVGLPPGFDADKTNSLGVRLVKILSGQIKGRLEFKNNPGAEFIVTFAVNAAVAKI
jgi:PAS domain S-box-containing protein